MNRQEMIAQLWIDAQNGLFPVLMPRRGAIAFCSLGRLGLITSDGPQEIHYHDGNVGFAWTGIPLTNGTVTGVGKDKGQIIEQNIGDGWSSRTPMVVGYIEDLIPGAMTNGGTHLFVNG